MTETEFSDPTDTFRECLKGKNLDKCKTNKCFTYNLYRKAGCIQCPFYKPSDSKRGYSGDLKDVEGKHIYRRWSSAILVYSVSIMLVLLLIMLVDNLKKGNTDIFTTTKNFILDFYPIIMLAFITWLVLLFINLTILKRLVAVVNESGLYINEKFITWDTIDTIQYEVSWPGKTGYDCCKLHIYTLNAHYIIPHAPRRLCKYIKKYSTNVSVKRDGTFWIVVVLMIVVVLFMAYFDK